MKLAADPVAEFFVAGMAGISEGIEQVVVSRDAAAVLRRAGEPAIYANGIDGVRLSRCTLFPEYCSFIFNPFPGFKYMALALKSRKPVLKEPKKLEPKFVRAFGTGGYNLLISNRSNWDFPYIRWDEFQDLNAGNHACRAISGL